MRENLYLKQVKILINASFLFHKKCKVYRHK